MLKIISQNLPDIQTAVDQYMQLVFQEMTNQNFSAYLSSEIKHKIDSTGDSAVWENDINIIPCYPKPFLTLYQFVIDIEDETLGAETKTNQDKLVLKEIKTWQIKIGVYKGYTKEELSNMVSTGKKYEFKRDGLFYDFVRHPEGFMDF